MVFRRSAANLAARTRARAPPRFTDPRETCVRRGPYARLLAHPDSDWTYRHRSAHVPRAKATTSMFAPLHGQSKTASEHLRPDLRHRSTSPRPGILINVAESELRSG